ncbi:unnamed protein product, partial [Staurois parvus]
NCRFSAVLSSRSDSVRKVQPRTGNCISGDQRVIGPG